MWAFSNCSNNPIKLVLYLRSSYSFFFYGSISCNAIKISHEEKKIYFLIIDVDSATCYFNWQIYSCIWFSLVSIAKIPCISNHIKSRVLFIYKREKSRTFLNDHLISFLITYWIDGQSSHSNIKSNQINFSQSV